MGPSAALEKWRDYFQYDVNQAASEFCELSVEEIAALADALGVAYFRDVMSRLGSDVGAGLLRNLPQEFRAQVLAALPQEKTSTLNEILSYAPGTAGALMAKEVLAVPVESNIGAVTEYLQSIPEDRKGKVSYIYAVDHNRRLRGVIQVRDLVFYPPQKPVHEILKSPVVQVETGMSQMDVARLLQRHRYLGLPVVNLEQRLVGIISADSVMQVFEEEAVDDLAKMVGTSSDEFRTLSVGKIISSRLPWLFINIASGLCCAFIMGLFKNNLQTIATLFLFIPVILGLSESMGVQGATIVVRNIAMGRVSAKGLRALFLREILVGIFIGIACGVLVGSAASLWKVNRLTGLALAVSLPSSIIIAAVLGFLFPLLFKRFKIDPAMASGPLVLALCDIQALIIYFAVSGAILRA